MNHRILETTALALLLCACGGTSGGGGTTAASSDATSYDQLTRLRFNQLAVRLDLPLFWVADADSDGAADPDEVSSLLFYPSEGDWVADGAFTPAFVEAYGAMVAASTTPAPSDARQALVFQEIDSVAPTQVHNDLSALPAQHRAFAARMLRVAGLIDGLYGRQVGATRLADQVAADDSASRALFRRNWGAGCRGAGTEDNPACSSIDGAPAQPVDIYPVALQAQEDFCQTIEAREDGSALLSPFVVVAEREGELVAVPYTEHYGTEMGAIADELSVAADEMTDPAEAALVTYLRAAAQAFRDNDWGPADEAWSVMNVRNSKWYVRVAPDEVYWDPCSRKAGFHLTFALINTASLVWQDQLTPLQQAMEEALAGLVGDAYAARDVSFHMPDFIDIVLNAGDDRDAFGATIGQSLPNWGAVAEEGRGRTVAMSNLYTDPDSAARRRAVASSLLTTETLAMMSDSSEAGIMSTILHEATHNLGPAHEYRFEGQTASEAFGGGMASMLEELKAQSGALFYLGFLREREVLTEQQQNEAYLDSITWAFGHISRGMYSPSGRRKAYSQLAAIQVGMLMDAGVIQWDAEAMAANGEDQGAFSIDFGRFPAAAIAMMERVVRIKAGNDRGAAEALATQYVDGDTVPQPIIVERFRRQPRASFVYSVDL